jgi:hypothetical protein
MVSALPVLLRLLLASVPWAWAMVSWVESSFSFWVS